MRRTPTSFVVIATAITAVVFVAPAAQAGFAGCHRHADFDRDGYHDLAVGAPFEDVGKRTNAGGVNVLYGASGGLNGSGDDFWTQDSSGVRGTAETGDYFGQVLAIGDFDGNGYSDLAVGIPQENSDQEDTGAVAVLYGRSGGLSSYGDDYWTLDTAGVRGSPEIADGFGNALAAGDFDRDGYSDLAIGIAEKDVATGEQFSTAGKAGAVVVLYGTSSGLSSYGDDYWTQHSSGVQGSAEYRDNFGFALASGDYDGDGYCDLAVGVPGEDLSGQAAICESDPSKGICNAGAVNVLFGGSHGLSASGDESWSQDSSGVIDPGEDGDMFGFTLAADDFDHDGRDDLAIGVLFEDIDVTLQTRDDAGAVNVLYGSSGGLTASGDDFFSQSLSDGTELQGGPSEDGDNFGQTLTTGDFNTDGNDDLVIGVPHESTEQGLLQPTLTSTGGVNVIYGGSNGLKLGGNQFWNQDSPGIKDTAEQGDNFGLSITTGRFNKGASYDLAVGVPTEKIGSYFEAGAVNVLYGSAEEGVSDTNQFWNQDSSGVLGGVEKEDWFGLGMSS